MDGKNRGWALEIGLPVSTFLKGKLVSDIVYNALEEIVQIEWHQSMKNQNIDTSVMRTPSLQSHKLTLKDRIFCQSCQGQYQIENR